MMKKYIPVGCLEDTEESLESFMGSPTPLKIPEMDFSMLLAGFRPYRRVPFEAFQDQEIKAIFEFMGRALLTHKKLHAHDKLFIIEIPDSINLNCVILDKVNQEKEALAKYLSKVDSRLEKVATMLRKLEENKAAINSLQEKKERLKKELPEVNK